MIRLAIYILVFGISVVVGKRMADRVMLMKEITEHQQNPFEDVIEKRAWLVKHDGPQPDSLTFGGNLRNYHAFINRRYAEVKGGQNV